MEGAVVHQLSALALRMRLTTRCATSPRLMRSLLTMTTCSPSFPSHEEYGPLSPGLCPAHGLQSSCTGHFTSYIDVCDIPTYT